MRLFHVRAKPGCAEKLVEKLGTTSADVVRGEPGNKGFVYGRGVGGDENVIIFASFWKDLDAVKARFGETWQESFLPEGYDAMIDEHWVEHIDVSEGWGARPE